MASYTIRLDAADLVFAAHHFVAMGAAGVEELHRHTFRVALTVTGPLDATGLLVDFHRAEAILRTILAAWNGRVLLPSEHFEIVCHNDGNAVVVTINGHAPQRFPVELVIRLPIVNASTELLAATLIVLVRNAFRTASLFTTHEDLYSFTVAIQEIEGYWAVVSE